jgi:antibiotic biosynthesis monooxygenase (ABM) superfamily enzyme
MDHAMMPLTVVITRTIRAGSEQAFEEAAKALIRKALTVPGYLGVQMIRPQAGQQDYRAVVKFRTPEEWESFQQAPDYVDFLAQVRPLLAVEPRVETECGLESWFTPRDVANQPLPRWKMALVTLLGVYPTSMFLTLTIGQWTAEWMFPLRALVFAASMVVMLTWIVMPLLNRGLHRWLHPQVRCAAPKTRFSERP